MGTKTYPASWVPAAQTGYADNLVAYRPRICYIGTPVELALGEIPESAQLAVLGH